MTKKETSNKKYVVVFGIHKHETAYKYQTKHQAQKKVISLKKALPKIKFQIKKIK